MENELKAEGATKALTCPWCGQSAHTHNQFPKFEEGWVINVEHDDTCPLACFHGEQQCYATEEIALMAWNTRISDFIPASEMVAGGHTRPAHDQATVEACAKVAENWNGETRDGDTVHIADTIRALSTTPTPDNAALVEAAQGLLANKFSTYKARNGREVGVEADDGEKVWLVHSDDIFTLQTALSTHAAQEGV